MYFWWQSAEWWANGARGPLRERDRRASFCGLNEGKGKPALFLGLFKILWEKRNVLFPDSQRGKVMMQHGWVGEMNGICYITWPVFQDLRLSMDCELPIHFFPLPLFVLFLKKVTFPASTFLQCCKLNSQLCITLCCGTVMRWNNKPHAKWIQIITKETALI